MSVVIDASITLSWYFKDQSTSATIGVLESVVRNDALAPSLWRSEVVNALKAGVKRRRINAAFRAEALNALRLLPVVIDLDGDRHAWSRTLEFSDRFGLTIYDAWYLELADRHNLPLATLDNELRIAGQALGIDVLGQ